MKIKRKLDYILICGVILFMTGCHKYNTQVKFYASGSTQSVHRVLWYLDQWVKDGPFVEYYRDGTLKRQGCYNYAFLVKEYKEVAQNGDWLEGFYRFGNMEGNFRKYYKDGTLAEDIFYKNEVPLGLYTKYFPNGQIQISGVYLFAIYDEDKINRRKSLQNGLWSEWDSSGKLIKSNFWQNGKMLD